MLAAAAGFAAVCASGAAEARDAPTVQLGDNQILEGTYFSGSRAFFAVPYAAAPVGSLRFRPPQPATPWTGVRSAQNWGPSCPQLGCPAEGSGHPAWPSINVSSCSEDCLILNVFTPVDAKDLPVMVYFHAGEFHFGSSHDEESDFGYGFGGRVVYVSVNVRVGPIGFAALPALRAMGDGSTGNYGMQDQRAALQWVRNNIHAFGGSGARVTIFGESSGGTSVMYHFTNPKSFGLFHRVVVESGGPTQVKDLSRAEENTRYLAAAVTYTTQTAQCPRPSQPLWKVYQAKELHAGHHKSSCVSLFNVSEEKAKQQCWERDNCTGVSVLELSEGGTELRLCQSVSMRDPFDSPKSVHTWMKWIDPGVDDSNVIKCLLSANVFSLINTSNYGMPFDDSFSTDLWAPVVDGVELNRSITGMLREGAVAPGVAVLMGSNLDEGTEFMSEAPAIPCNATETDLRLWSTAMYGSDLAGTVVHAYRPSEISEPVPGCKARFDPTEHKYITVPASVHYSAAMRSAGDYTIGCRARDGVKAAAMGGAAAYRYLFSITPTYSVNWNVPLSSVGAFHGAEVPFVFGAQFELKTDGERYISRAMGCYWANFAETGDPNVGTDGCAQQLPTWYPYTPGNDTSIVFRSNVTIGNEAGVKKEKCDAFEKFPAAGFVRELR
eukprot:TRINITY_DN6710_c2_g1_i2.p1 TRINITY_DN6710_c2_g1~~TRINITY_DN6710_c2_g1_i2.p1  ORF type:complete len:702 (+),score=129.11 TRINITY_DN6710_c2_g1_i2:116-2107(+)